MRLDDYRSSDNVSDQRGQSFGGGLGGGGLGMILSLVGSRFGIVGVLLVLAGAWFFGLLGGGGGGQQIASPTAQNSPQTNAQGCAANAESTFACRVLASTEDTWNKLYAQAGQQYQPAQLVFYSQQGSSGCGAAQSAMGPFYCPTDKGIYLDTTFFQELEQKFGAAGDFAQAYVIAHEVGHHIQTLNGTSDKVRAAQSRASSTEGNRIQVAMELQADCLAGVWAANNRERIEPGDVEEGLRAAQAIGDDTLQKQMQGRVVPESFTHGSAEQRMAWLRRGLESGNPAMCDTFAGR